MPEQPASQAKENIVTPKSSSGGKTALVVLLVAIIFGLGGAAGTWFVMNPKLEVAEEAALSLDRELGMVKADLIASQAAVIQMTAKIAESNLPKIGDYAVNVRIGENPNEFIVMNNGFEAGTISLNATVPIHAEMFRVTANHAYIQICFDELGENTPNADPCVIGLYRLDLSTNEIVRIELPKGASLQDISPGESKLLYIKDANAIAIKDLLTDFESLYFAPEGEFHTFGQARFSPDGTRFAYAAIGGNLDQPTGAAYIVSLLTNEQEEIKRNDEGLVNVRYWSSNEFVVVQ